MYSPRFILSSCGISVFTNGAPADVRHLLIRHANDASLQGDAAESLEPWLEMVEQKFPAAPVSEARERSAELNGLLGIYGGEWPAGGSRDRLVLVHTDTALGRRAADVLKAWLEARGAYPDSVGPLGLNTRSTGEFRFGLSSLIQWLEEQDLPGWAAGVQPVFNLVGGFKAVQAYLTVLGMVYEAEVVYQFEGSAELLRIPPLPGLAGSLEATARTVVERNLLRFRRLALQLPVPDWPDPPGTLVLTDRQDLVLSTWGDLVWARLRPEIYRRGLLESPDERVRFSPRFRNDAEAFIGTSQMEDLNSRVDDLVRFLYQRAGGVNPVNPDRLNLKPIHAQKPPSTHEVYAWSDQDARRVYLHFEDGNRAVLDSLGKHL